MSRTVALTLVLAFGHISTVLGQMPDDAELEAGGARIGEVRVLTGEIFDTSNAAEDRSLYRLANRLHVGTREQAVRAQLLFKEGDPYSRRALDETARNLRHLRYVREPQVRPVAWHDGVVDVEVRTTDVWTLTPGVSFGRSGGANHAGFELEDMNLFGRGKRASVGYSTDVDRTSTLFRWSDPNVWGSRWTLDAQSAQSDDGSTYAFAVDRPFYSMNTTWSAGLSMLSDERREDRYSLGEIVDDYGVAHRNFDMYAGLSGGLHDGWTRRLIAGYRFDSSEFTPGERPLITSLPEDRTIGMPYVRFESIQDRFAIARNQDQIARTEDVQLGGAYSFEAGLAGRAFGSDRTAMLLSATASRGLRWGEASTLLLAASIGGRMESGSFRDASTSGSARFYHRTSENTLFSVRVASDIGYDLDLDHLLQLGGDTGLRGYPLRYQTGSSRALVSVEERFFTNWYPFRLAHVGAAVFADVGRTWGEDPTHTPQRGLLKSVGAGLRFGNTRSALGNVLHVDVAFPLDRDASIDSMQFLIQTKASF